MPKGRDVTGAGGRDCKTPAEHVWLEAAAWAFRHCGARVALSFYRDGSISKELLVESLKARHNWRHKCSLSPKVEDV